MSIFPFKLSKTNSKSLNRMKHNLKKNEHIISFADEVEKYRANPVDDEESDEDSDSDSDVKPVTPIKITKKPRGRRKKN